MRATVGVLAVLAGCGLAAAADEKYASKEATFKVAFPKGAKVAATQSDVGGLKQHKFEVKDADKEYVVVYLVLPESAKNVTPKALFDGGEKGGVRQSGGKLVTSKDLTAGPDKLPAREVVDDAGGAEIR